MKARRYLVETGILLLFLGIAVLAFWSRWNGYSPFVFLHGDAANIASFAAAREHPQLFQRDEILGEPQNFRIYIHVQVFLVQILEDIFGDYGTASVVLLIPYVFLQLLGFYLLGRTLFHSRFWALLLSLINIVWVNLPHSYWGVYSDPQPRMSFQALWPFLIAGVFRWKNQPIAWPWLMAAAGALTYLHGVGGFVWGPVLWLGFWLLLPSSWPLHRRVLHMGMVGGAFLVTALPFLLHYLQNHAVGKPSIEPELLYRIMEERLQPGYIDIPLALSMFTHFWLYPPRAIALSMALWGSYLMFTRNENRRRDMLLIGTWAVGIVLVSAVIPLIEQSIEKTLGLVPTQIDLIRGLRFFVPLVLLLCFWFLAEVDRYPKRYFRALRFSEPALLATLVPSVIAVLWGLQELLSKRMLYGIARVLAEWLESLPTLKEWLGTVYRAISGFTLESLAGWLILIGGGCLLGFLIMRRQRGLLDQIQARLSRHPKVLAPIMGLMFLLVWVQAHAVGYTGPGFWANRVFCWLQGHKLCPESQQESWDGTYEALLAIREHVPPGEALLATHNTLRIRYGALRPVVYSYKDGGILSYTNPEALVEWYRRRQIMQEISAIEDPKQRLQALLAFAKQLKVQFVTVHQMPFEVVAFTPEAELLWFTPKNNIAILKVRR